MGELTPSGEPKPVRTDPEYLERVLDSHFTQTDSPIFGVHAGPKPPESFEELQEIVDKSRDANCGVSEEVDAMVELIGAMPDRNEITKQLPYDLEDESVAFILPI